MLLVIQDAKSYNENRANPNKLKELGLTYEEVLNVADNGVMGYIEIPIIDVYLPIYHGVSENVLSKEQTYMSFSICFNHFNLSSLSIIYPPLV